MAHTTNFKTYEAQARLLAALVASLDDKRLDYKKIAQCFGGGVTYSAIEHRFRPIKVQAEFIHSVLEAGGDPGEYSVWDIKSKDEIHQYFGSSTPDGIGFQFRAIKQGANALKNAVEKGEDPIAAFSDHISGSGSASVPATPTRRAAGSVKRGRAATKTPASRATPASKRRKATVIKPESGFDDTDLPEVDYDELDQSPTRDVAKVKRTPRKNPALLPRSAWAKPDPAAGIMPLKSSFARAQEAQASRAASATSAPSPAATIPHPGMNYFPFTAAGAANSTSAPAPPLTVTPNNANANGTVASMTGASHSSIDMTHSSSPPANNNHHNIGSAANARPPSAPGASSTTLIGKPTTMTMSAALGSFAEAEFASYNVSTTDPVGFTDEEKELFSDHVNFDHAWEDDIGDC